MLLSLSAQLAGARLRAKKGDFVLNLLSILAFAVVTCLTIIVASGTWMFYERYRHPRGLIKQVIEIQPFQQAILWDYVLLSIVACAFLVVPLFSLASSAAILGSRSREQRLSMLRLLGMSNFQVTIMGFLDFILQFVLGFVLGTAVSFLLIPLFQQFHFQGVPVGADEVPMPFMGFVIVFLSIFILGAIATWFALVRVRISPLGVVKRQLPKSLKHWRLLVIVVAISLALFTPEIEGNETLTQLLKFSPILLIPVGIDFVMPYLYQFVARVLSATPFLTVSWASRRIVIDPKTTWRRVSGISILMFLAGLLIDAKFNVTTNRNVTVESFAQAFTKDISTGVILTIVFTFIIVGISSLMNQISDEFERAPQTLILSRIGVPSKVGLRVNFMEVLGPLTFSSIVCFGLGKLGGASSAEKSTQLIEGLEKANLPLSNSLVLSIFAGGLVLIAVALLSTASIRHRILARSQRRTE